MRRIAAAGFSIAAIAALAGCATQGSGEPKLQEVNRTSLPAQASAAAQNHTRRSAWRSSRRSTAIARQQSRQARSRCEAAAGGGTELREWPEPVAAAMAKASNEVLAELAATSDLSGRVAAAYSGYLAKAREWSKWSDAAMLGLRNSHPAG